MEKAQRQQSEKQSKQKKSKKAKFLAPEYMIIFDDLSSELKSRSLLSLLKFNRHFKAKLIISSQWLHDLLPESRKQIDLFLIFKGFSDTNWLRFIRIVIVVSHLICLMLCTRRLPSLNIAFFMLTVVKILSDEILIVNLLSGQR